MRTIKTVATIFSYMSLLFGLTGFIGPLVRGNRDKTFNTKPGLQFGFAATNWIHSLAHTLFGAVGLVPAVRDRYARQYVSSLTGIFAALAGMGWMTTRNRDGIHMRMGMAINRADNIIHTVWAAIGLFFALQPNFFENLPSQRQMRQTLEHTRSRVEEKIQPQREKMPV